MSRGWEVKPLGAVSDINYGYTESASFEAVGPRFLRITDIQNDRVDWASVPYCPIAATSIPKYRLATGDIVFARTGATTGKSFLVDNPPEAVFASYLIRLRLNDERLLPSFLSLFFQTDAYWQSIKDGSTGSAQGGFNATKLAALSVPIPPLPEQERIVAILDEAFEGIDTAVANAKKNLANARELFDNYLNSIFAQRREGWIEKKLEDTVDKTCSLSYGIVQPGEDVNDGLPIVRPTDLQQKIIYLDGLKRINPTLAEGYKRTKLDGGELLLCVRGGTGTVSIAAKELAGSNVTRGIVPIRFDPKVVVQEFGYFSLISKGVQDQIKAATYGAALMQINIRDLRKVSLDLPPLDVQKSLLKIFNDIFAEVERLASIYERKAAALAELRQALLQKAFAGELTARSAEAVQEAAE